ncbi:MAG: diphthine--ammonia ligase [Candidatus Heimdallarchaeota archaeon]|nr:MAG: diphthine--ammonia ligase [Candidatus Heimdallarchaeota archaeon]
MKVICLVSGGKDSILALWLALHQFEVISILTVISSCSESLLFHIPNSQYVAMVADILDVPHQTITINTCNVEEEITILKSVLIESGAEAMITGAIRSEFQRFKFNRAAQDVNMKCFSPLWRISPKILLSELLDNNFHIIISSVSGMGLKKELLGKKITPELLKTLQQVVPESELSMVGEGGEFESFVLDAPFFPAYMKILESKIHWNEYREEGYFEILKMQFHPKQIS